MAADEVSNFPKSRVTFLEDIPPDSEIEFWAIAPTIGVRHLQMIFMLLMLAIGVGMRVHLSVAIVAMTERNTSSNPDIPTYNWENKSVILSSFYWGYVWLQVLAAELGRKFGPKHFLLGAMFVNSCAMSLIPLMAAQFGSYGVMSCRVFMGLSQGFFYACVQVILSKWTPLSERARMGTLALCGAPIGTIITMPMVGYISSSSLGWPFSCYLYGGLGYAWVVLYAIFGANGPQDHSGISEAERKYIEQSQDLEGSKHQTPWKSIFTSVPVWAIFCMQLGSVWGYTTLLSEIPTYMDKIMGFDMKANGLLSASPYLTSFVLGFVFAYTSDYIINHNYLSRTWTRKISTAVATLSPAIALTILGFLPEDATTLSLFMLIAAVGLQSSANSGYIVNNLDLSPNFAGLIMGLCNSSTNFISIFGPIVVQFIVTDETDKLQWRIIFLISAVLYTLPNIFYMIFASGEIQPWDSPESGRKGADQDRSRKKMSVISIMSM